MMMLPKDPYEEVFIQTRDAIISLFDRVMMEYGVKDSSTSCHVCHCNCLPIPYGYVTVETNGKPLAPHERLAHAHFSDALKDVFLLNKAERIAHIKSSCTKAAKCLKNIHVDPQTQYWFQLDVNKIAMINDMNVSYDHRSNARAFVQRAALDS